MLRTLLLLILLFDGMLLKDQENSLRVLVKDASGEPLPKAHVALLRHREVKPPKSQEPDPPTVDSMAETDVRGEAILKAQKGYRYRVEVRVYGFLPWNLADFRLKGPALNVVLEVGHFVIH
jgi:hypothetical protein